MKENFTRSLCEPPTSEQRIHFTSLQRQQQSLRFAFSPSIHLQRSYIAVPSLTDGAVCCVYISVYYYYVCTNNAPMLCFRHLLREMWGMEVLIQFFCSKHVNNKSYTCSSYLHMSTFSIIIGKFQMRLLCNESRI